MERGLAEGIRRMLSCFFSFFFSFLFNYFLNVFLSFIFWLHCAVCGILVPQPEIEPMHPAAEAWSQPLDHQGSPLLFILLSCEWEKLKWCVEKKKEAWTTDYPETVNARKFTMSSLLPSLPLPLLPLCFSLLSRCFTALIVFSV